MHIHLYIYVYIYLCIHIFLYIYFSYDLHYTLTGNKKNLFYNSECSVRYLSLPKNSINMRIYIERIC